MINTVNIVDEEWMTRIDAATFLGISRATIDKYLALTRAGKMDMPFRQLVKGGKVYFHRVSIQQWFNKKQPIFK